MTKSATTSRRAAIIAAAQQLAIDHGYTGFTVDDLAEAVGVSRRTLFNHVTSKEEAVLGVLPVLSAEQVESLRAGGPSGDLFEDLLDTVLGCIDGDDAGLDDWQRLHDVIERTPELFVRVKDHVEVLTEQVVTHLTAQPGVDPDRARMALTLVGGVVQRSVLDCIDDPTTGPLTRRIRRNLDLTREILLPRA